MIDLDIRLGLSGVKLENKEAVIDSINTDIAEYKELLDIPCKTKDVYRLYKDVRKKLKESRNAIKYDIKEKVASYTETIINDQKELYEMYDKLYNSIDDAIKQYEEDNEVGAAKAKITRAANKAADEAETVSLNLSLACPSIEVKERIIQFATDLGATVL